MPSKPLIPSKSFKNPAAKVYPISEGHEPTVHSRISFTRSNLVVTPALSDSRPPSAAFKHEAYNEALKRSLLESQLERDFLASGVFSRYSTGVESHEPYSVSSTLSERMLTATTGVSMTTTTADLQEIEDFSSEDFPEFRIETAAEKMKVNLTDDIVVSLTSRERDSKIGIRAAGKQIKEIRTDLFESRLAESCVWLDLSGNSLTFDDYASDQHVMGTVKSRKIAPGNLPDMWQNFKVLEELKLGEGCSEDSTCTRGNQLHHIPPSLFQTSSLRVLSFSSNRLQHIPNEISNLVNLEELYLDDNELLDFQPALLSLPKLKLLDMDHNSLESVEITDLPRPLTCLRLKGNNIAHIALNANRNSLRQLDLSCNNLQCVDKISFKSLTKLKLLDLSSNIIENVPRTIGKLEYLRKLYLDDNLITELCPSVCLLQKLTSLNLSQNSISELPPEIGNLVMLRELYIENNKLDSLPLELRHIPRLLSLCVSGNKFTEIPPVVGHLPQLRDLLLFNNLIRRLDTTLLASCKNLIVLGLSMNRIKKIPAEVSKLANIRIIQLDSNRISSLPEELGEVRTLKYLSLNNNRLTYIPDSLSSLENLVGLLLDGNSLTHLPESIGRLGNLRVLSLKHNYIETIPESLSLLVKIELVDVAHNRLTRLPTTVSQLSETVELRAGNNQLRVPPQEVADKGIVSIKGYMDTRNGLGDGEVDSIHSEFETTAL